MSPVTSAQMVPRLGSLLHHRIELSRRDSITMSDSAAVPIILMAVAAFIIVVIGIIFSRRRRRQQQEMEREKMMGDWWDGV
ncbi:MAG: hypothetical protein M1834_005506 [Cirrosporium novae-zelandiae]|nr:MAG: hypothetical protein M1834_005506 [Cirrosporium novae-zelandiae]